jgi:hypothetical protein
VGAIGSQKADPGTRLQNCLGQPGGGRINRVGTFPPADFTVVDGSTLDQPGLRGALGRPVCYILDQGAGFVCVINMLIPLLGLTGTFLNLA